MSAGTLTPHPAVLPSASAAYKLVRGEAGGVPETLLAVISRASIIATGLKLAGERDKVLKYALAASAAVEVMVIIHALAARNVPELAQAQRLMGEGAS